MKDWAESFDEDNSGQGSVSKYGLGMSNYLIHSRFWLVTKLGFESGIIKRLDCYPGKFEKNNFLSRLLICTLHTLLKFSVQKAILARRCMDPKAWTSVTRNHTKLVKVIFVLELKILRHSLLGKFPFHWLTFTVGNPICTLSLYTFFHMSDISVIVLNIPNFASLHINP